jgi:hypothetical protein
MRNPKESAGSIKAGAKAKSRAATTAAPKGSAQSRGRTGAGLTGQGGASLSSRKSAPAKGGAHK